MYIFTKDRIYIQFYLGLSSLTHQIVCGSGFKGVSCTDDTSQRVESGIRARFWEKSQWLIINAWEKKGEKKGTASETDEHPESSCFLFWMMNTDYRHLKVWRVISSHTGPELQATRLSAGFFAMSSRAAFRQKHRLCEATQQLAFSVWADKLGKKWVGSESGCKYNTGKRKQLGLQLMTVVFITDQLFPQLIIMSKQQ